MIKYNIHRFDGLDSTNNYTMEKVRQNVMQHGDVVLASFQSNGKGTAGKHWISDPGKNLLMSVVFQHHLPIEKAYFLNMFVATALHTTIGRYLEKTSLNNKGLKIKYPNDLLWNKAKMAGILTQNVVKGNKISTSVVGVGVNLNQQQFVGLEKNAFSPISLGGITENSIDVSEFLSIFLDDFSAYYTKLMQQDYDSIKECYQQKMYGFDEPVAMCVGDRAFFGQVTEVLPENILSIQEKGVGLKINYDHLSFI